MWRRNLAYDGGDVEELVGRLPEARHHRAGDKKSKVGRKITWRWLQG
jgi:hypothetical protein